MSRFEHYLLCQRIVAFVTEEDDPFPRFFDPRKPSHVAVHSSPDTLSYGWYWCLFGGDGEEEEKYVLAYSPYYAVVAETYEKITGFSAPLAVSEEEALPGVRLKAY